MIVEKILDHISSSSCFLYQDLMMDEYATGNKKLYAFWPMVDYTSPEPFLPAHPPVPPPSARGGEVGVVQSGRGTVGESVS